MSLDYICYALAKRPLYPEKIAEASPSWIFEFANADSGKPLHKSRALPPYCLVWGCRRSSHFDLAALLRSGSEGLAKLYRRGSLACCELEIESDFEADSECLDDLPARHRRMLERAGSCYSTRTAAGRNNLSWRLQIAVCRAIALAAGGLLEEPQMGKFRAVAARA